MKKLSEIQMFVLLILFSLVGFLSIAVTAYSYKAIIKKGEEGFTSSISLSYIANKFGQKDRLGFISIEEREGRQIVVLQEIQDGERYETWIYAYQNKLYETYVLEGTEVDLENQQGVIRYKIEVKIKDSNEKKAHIIPLEIISNRTDGTLIMSLKGNILEEGTSHN